MERAKMLELCSGVKQIDAEAGLYYSVGNVENYKKAFLVALKSIRSKLSILTGMLEWKDYSGLTSVARMLNRICTSIGAKHLAEYTMQIETASLNSDVAYLDVQLPLFYAELETLLTDLEQLMRKIDHAEREEKKHAGFSGMEESVSDTDVFELYSMKLRRRA